MRLYTRLMIKQARPLFALLLSLTGFTVCSNLAAEQNPSLVWDMLANASYQGIEDHPVQLSDGLWEGQPFVEGGAARPRVGLAMDFLVQGDVNDDGKDEALVLIWQSSGGSGTFNYIALVEFEDGSAGNVATTELGDRVSAVKGTIRDGVILVDVIEHGPDEPACCPTQKATRSYDGNLNPISNR